MKKLLILVFGILIISCNQTKKDKEKSESTTTIEESENFDWLLGKWKRLNEEEGKETFENWNKIKETDYSGIGFTMQNGDTIKQEEIRLTKMNGKWNLTVKVPEEPESITFNGISYTESEFTCENNEIDFPNKIKYWKNGDRINAMVSGGEMEIHFEFEKLNNSKQNVLIGELTNNTICKNELDSSLAINSIPDTLSCVQFVFDKVNNNLKLKHLNAGFNCCPDSLYVQTSLDGNTITIQEYETNSPCRCKCLYDLDIELNGVEAKEYKIVFIEPYGIDQEKIVFDIDLKNNTEGDFCVTRKQYPWGINSMN